MAEMTLIFLLEEDELLMATKPMYLSSDESEHSTPKTTPDQHHESIYPDSFNQANSVTNRTTVKYGLRKRFLLTNLKHIYDIWRQRTTKCLSNIWEPEQNTLHNPQRQKYPI